MLSFLGCLFLLSAAMIVISRSNKELLDILRWIFYINLKFGGMQQKVRPLKVHGGGPL